MGPSLVYKKIIQKSKEGSKVISAPHQVLHCFIVRNCKFQRTFILQVVKDIEVCLINYVTETVFLL